MYRGTMGRKSLRSMTRSRRGEGEEVEGEEEVGEEGEEEGWRSSRISVGGRQGLLRR